MEKIHEVLTYIFGSTTLVSIIIAWKSRKSEIKKAEANALETIQKVYDKFTEDTDKRFESMRVEIGLVKDENFQFQNLVNELKMQVENYKTNCAQCAHNKTK